MKKIKKPVSILLALMMAFGLFSIVPLTADASSITGFFDCRSGSAEGYFFYSDHFYKVEWTGINTESTAKVQLCVGNGCLYATVRGTTTYSNISIAFFRNATLRSNWTPSEIENLIAGQSSSGYTNDQLLAEGASARVYKKVCTITCVAANAPAWDWSDDFTACTATFTCADEPSRTKTVEASVSTEGSVATASVTFNSITYTETITIPGFSVNKAGDTYTIRSEEGWNTFCECLQDNDTYNRFIGKTVLLDRDISVSTMAGSSGHDFMGTFNGQGHTLTVSYGSADSPFAEDKAAPFRNVENGCVIENLHIAGTIYTSKKYAGGIVGTQYGSVLIKNCRSSVTIISATGGDGSHGGLVGLNGSGSGSELTIQGCVFDGKMLTVGETATTSCSGFVGWKNRTVSITDSLYAPAALESGETEIAGGATFVRNGSAGTKCYYTRALGDAQGNAARTVTAGENVTIGYGTAANTYNVSGITAYSTGLARGGDLYACEGDEVTFTLGYTGTPAAGFQHTGYSVNAGTLEGTENPYTLTIPGEDVTVNAAFDLTGDANRDSEINVNDVTAIQRHLADLEFIPAQFLVLADANGNGEVNIADATYLQMYIAQYDITLG